jgi:hypothetical protein
MITNYTKNLLYIIVEYKNLFIYYRKISIQSLINKIYNWHKFKNVM